MHALGTTTETPRLTGAELVWAHATLRRMEDYFSATVIGQSGLRRALLVALIGRGHVLLESVPGLAKTLAASTFAASVRADFARIQCTPDLMPSDIIGSQVFDPSAVAFTTELGPVHTNFVLLDEINRSSARTQSAMLEAMQERQTTIGRVTHHLPDPFFVMATQNPIEEEGTYALPQAQLDRFLLKEVVEYPSVEEEYEMLGRVDLIGNAPPAPAVASLDDVERLQQMARLVHVDPAIRRYIVDIIDVTRHPADHLSADRARWVEHGASPRGAIAFLVAARVMALLAGRDHVLPDDVVALRHAVLRHRIVLTFEAVAEGVDVTELVDLVVSRVPTP